ncbi:MAG: hypothetical protein ABIH03_14920, partial [Pseudomonadota bacterium]
GAPPGATADRPVLFATRLQRMQTPNSPHLARFKEAYAREHRYWLTVAILAPSGEPLFQQHRILKSRVVFRRAAEIGGNDIDRIVLARREGAKASQN